MFSQACVILFTEGYSVSRMHLPGSTHLDAAPRCSMDAPHSMDAPPSAATDGWYASYWNAYLILVVCTLSQVCYPTESASQFKYKTRVQS